jgi:DNA end-binding protein Ku
LFDPREERPMTARAMWKAEVDIDDIRIPVKLYAAVADASVHFRMLHAKDRAAIKQMVDPETQEPVPPEHIRRAIEVDRGVYVVIKPEEQEALEPQPSHAIAVERVVSAETVDERWFDRPYYLGPDGGGDAYFDLARRRAHRARRGAIREAW